MFTKVRETINSWKYNWFWTFWITLAISGLVLAGVAIIEYYLWRVS